MRRRRILPFVRLCTLSAKQIGERTATFERALPTIAREMGAGPECEH